MPRLHLGLPLWLASASRLQTTWYAPLRGALSVDVVIVGGGITGAVLAWQFANAGVRVALLEATRLGRGSTAASTALLMQEPDEDFTRLCGPLRTPTGTAYLGAQPPRDARVHPHASVPEHPLRASATRFRVLRADTRARIVTPP